MNYRDFSEKIDAKVYECVDSPQVTFPVSLVLLFGVWAFFLIGLFLF